MMKDEQMKFTGILLGPQGGVSSSYTCSRRSAEGRGAESVPAVWFVCTAGGAGGELLLEPEREVQSPRFPILTIPSKVLHKCVTCCRGGLRGQFSRPCDGGAVSRMWQWTI